MHSCGYPNVNFEVEVQAELKGILPAFITSSATAAAENWKISTREFAGCVFALKGITFEWVPNKR